MRRDANQESFSSKAVTSARLFVCVLSYRADMCTIDTVQPWFIYCQFSRKTSFFVVSKKEHVTPLNACEPSYKSSPLLKDPYSQKHKTKFYYTLQPKYLPLT
jgi:hypothetical protein